MRMPGSNSAIALALSFLALLGKPARSFEPVAVPEFPSLDPRSWIGTPVSVRGLRGQVILLDVWTFG
jgi:hypothetical protein